MRGVALGQVLNVHLFQLLFAALFGAAGKINGQQHRRWLACGVAHHLGLDVHDCAQARYESYQNAKIRPGMIFTIEPGLYFREDDLLIPPEYRGIGIRIEDDVLMTEDGPEWISAGIPKQIDDVEAWMADMAAEGAKA